MNAGQFQRKELQCSISPAYMYLYAVRTAGYRNVIEKPLWKKNFWKFCRRTYVDSSSDSANTCCSIYGPFVATTILVGKYTGLLQ